MSLEAWGDDNGEDLVDLAASCGYSLHSDDKWRETADEAGLTDEQMWSYIWDRRESESEDILIGEYE